jgi:hypothetical protein
MARTGRMLGHVIAHEAAHMLLPALSHSTEGIMRCEWNPQDFRLAMRREMRFTPAQAELIRNELSKRWN